MAYKKCLKNYQEGVSLVIAFFVMVVILAVVLSISTLLYKQVNFIRNMGDSVAAFYAADSGVEKFLYYDKHVFPVMPEGQVAARGMCTMYLYDPTTNPDACLSSSEGWGLDTSLYCEPDLNFYPPLPPDGCDPSVCNNCEIVFDTDLSNGGSYHVDATVRLSEGNKFFELEIKSKGVFNNASRQVNITSQKVAPDAVIKIENACADPKSVQQDLEVKIKADVSSSLPDYSISAVVATIQNSLGEIVADAVPLSSSDGLYWETTWSTGELGTYYVSLTAEDSFDPPNFETQEDIQPCDIQ
jgi:Ca2+/Na+ antiporter